MRKLLVVWLALLAALAGAPAASQDLPPRPPGPVYDGANIISDGEEQLLDQRLRDYNRTTGRAVIVATVPSLDGLEIEPYAQELAELNLTPVQYSALQTLCDAPGIDQKTLAEYVSFFHDFLVRVLFLLKSA